MPRMSLYSGVSLAITFIVRRHRRVRLSISVNRVTYISILKSLLQWLSIRIINTVITLLLYTFLLIDLGLIQIGTYAKSWLFDIASM